MASDVVMPRLSDSMEEGTVLKWLVKEGEQVKRGEPLVEIETDKANMTYDSDSDGTLVEIVAKEGDTLAVGEPIARLGEADERGGKRTKDEGKGDEGGAAKTGDGDERADEGEDEGDEGADDDGDEQQGDADGEQAQGGPSEAGETDEGAAEPEVGERDDASADGKPDGRVKASPVARRMAGELGVELARVEGSGPGGRIVKADVEAAAKEADGRGNEDASKEERKDDGRPEPTRAGEAGAKGELQVQELSRVQQTVSRRMAESKATAPDYQLEVEVDMTSCVELHRRLRELAEGGERSGEGEAAVPSFNDMVVKAAGSALREFPRVNGAYRDGRFELYSRVNIGIAVAARDALVVPTIFDADTKSLGEIAREARRLIEKVRDGKITPPEVGGGTFTVSNLGMFGIERFSAIINPPQAALLTVGAQHKKPVVDDRGRVAARESMTLTLVCDHRILYGADGARFLARVRELLESPLALAL